MKKPFIQAALTASLTEEETGNELQSNEQQLVTLLTDQEKDEATKLTQIASLFSSLTEEKSKSLINRPLSGLSGYNVLQYAINEGLEEITEFFLNNGAEVNAGNFLSPLTLAASKNNPPLIRQLIERGAYVNPAVANQLYSPLAILFTRHARQHYQAIAESVDLLLNAGASPHIGLKTFIDQKRTTDGFEPLNWTMDATGRYRKADVPVVTVQPIIRASL